MEGKISKNMARMESKTVRVNGTEVRVIGGSSSRDLTVIMSVETV